MFAEIDSREICPDSIYIKHTLKLLKDHTGK